jgi:Acyl-CoA synthetases (AMP-forming)/AMP-acid ligases II
MGRAPLLIIQLKQGQSATREDILKFMDGKIAKWWMPDDVAFVEAFRTPRPARS